MLRIRQACYMILLLALFPAVGAAQRTPERLSGDPRVAWLRENVYPIRSIDPDDEDFTDLAHLRETLQGVRLVLLGEADHGSGSDFLAKTRLVKFLHRELGFDVLAFESPMYDATVGWDRLRAGASPREAFLLGAATWAGATQMQPLVAYLAEQARGARPLELAGFDHQNQWASGFYFAEDLARFLSERDLGGPLVDPESPESGVLQRLLQAQYQYRVTPLPDSSVVHSFASVVQSATTAVSTMGDDDAQHWSRILKNLGCQIRHVDAGWWRGRFGLGDCHRDRQMAENLLWLANERYPDRKIIVWSATLHAARMPEPPPFLRDRAASAFPSMGQRIGEVFGSQSYVIGVTSYRGSARAFGRLREIVVDQHPEPEFEELMAAAGFDYGFLDLSRPAAEESWAGGEFLARPMAHTTYPAVWSDVLDALVFVREQEPRQEVEQPAEDIAAINEVRERKVAAFLRGDTDSYVALFTEDCVVLPPDGPRIKGRAALRSWLEGVHEDFALSGGSMESEYIRVGGDDWASELYRARRAVAPRAGGEVAEERYRGAHIYRRQPDGTWRIAQDVWNAVAAGGGR